MISSKTISAHLLHDIVPWAILNFVWARKPICLGINFIHWAFIRWWLWSSSELMWLLCDSTGINKPWWVFLQVLIRPHCLHVYISMHMFWWLIFCLWVQLWEVGNPLWPSDAIWQQRTGTTLAQVMAYCLQVPWNNLNQCWHIVQEYNFTGNITRYLSLISICKLTATFKAQWVKNTKTWYGWEQ